MLSLSLEYRALLLEKATKLYLSIGSRGYTTTISPIVIPHENLDTLNRPIFGKDGKDSHEIAVQQNDEGQKIIVITTKWLDDATIERVTDLPVVLMSEFLIKDQDGRVLIREACYPLYVLDWEGLGDGIVIKLLDLI